jgi:hypothetical protein
MTLHTFEPGIDPNATIKLNENFNLLQLSSDNTTNHVFRLMALNQSGLFNYDGLSVQDITVTINTPDYSDSFSLTTVHEDIVSILSYAPIKDTNKIRFFCRKDTDNILFDLDLSDFSYDILAPSVPLSTDSLNVTYGDFNIKYCHVYGDNIAYAGFKVSGDKLGLFYIVYSISGGTLVYSYSILYESTLYYYNSIPDTMYALDYDDPEGIIIFWERFAQQTGGAYYYYRKKTSSRLNSSSATNIYSIGDTDTVFSNTKYTWLKNGEVVLSCTEKRYSDGDYKYRLVKSDSSSATSLQNNGYFEEQTSGTSFIFRGNYCVAYNYRNTYNNYRGITYIKKDGTYETLSSGAPWTDNFSALSTDTGIYAGITSRLIIMNGEDDMSIVTTTSNAVSSLKARSSVQSFYATCEDDIPFIIDGLDIHKIGNLSVSSADVTLTTPISGLQFAYVNLFDNSYSVDYNMESYDKEVYFIFSDETEELVDFNKWATFDEEKTLTGIRVVLSGYGGGSATLTTNMIPYRGV